MELRPDVIVMDINMPGMDGVAAAEIISQRLPIQPDHHDERPRRGGAAASGPSRPARASSSSSRSAATSSAPASSGSTSGSSAAATQFQAIAAAPVPPRACRDDGRGPPGDRRLLARRAGPAAPPSPPTSRSRCTARPGPGLPGRRQPAVRRRRRPAQPEPQEPVDRSMRSRPASRTATSSTRCVIDHSTGIRVLLAPPSPEGADLVTPAYLRKIVDHLRSRPMTTSWSTCRPA